MYNRLFMLGLRLGWQRFEFTGRGPVVFEVDGVAGVIPTQQVRAIISVSDI